MDENAVVDAVCRHLERTGHRVLQRLGTTEHGIDIIAEHPATKRRLLIEAKGGTSSREGSNRFGKPYTQSQIFDRCAKGVFTALELRAQEPATTTSAIMAAPDTRDFRRYLTPVASLAKSVGIGFWLVDQQGTVHEL